MFLAAVAQAAFTYTPSLTSHTFEDLRSTGGMGLIRSAEIKSALYDYYDFHDTQRQYMQLTMMIEFRYFELIAWLPRTRGLQREQILIHGIRISCAEKLLESLRGYSK